MPRAEVAIWHDDRDGAFVAGELVPLVRAAGFTPVAGADGAGTACCLAVVSPGSADSERLRDAVAGALAGARARVIAVTVAGCRPADLHPLLAGADAVDFTSHRKRARKRLRALLAAGAAPVEVRRLADVTAGPAAVTRAAAFRLRGRHTLAVACGRPGAGLSVAVVLDGEELFRQEFETPVPRWAQHFRVEAADGLVSVGFDGAAFDVRVTVGGVEVLRV